MWGSTVRPKEKRGPLGSSEKKETVQRKEEPEICRARQKELCVKGEGRTPGKVKVALLQKPLHPHKVVRLDGGKKKTGKRTSRAQQRWKSPTSNRKGWGKTAVISGGGKNDCGA